ncbi:LOW QUALITY PROTEIN: HLA class II histocompatibility antigen, DR alpha chain-like [Paroedura picta]|uniref:LOW QUALITY PROTEIN: HLA class II histocompatibility antigen, DR alpha chain-like n=1 Tax=Paroedura picta TaxID=143630 RepID=UPI0040569200
MGLADYLWLLPLLGGHLVPGEDVMTQVEFVQRAAQPASEQGPGEFMFDWDGDEVFHVDLERKEAVWRLPQFQEFTSFQAEGALANMAILHNAVDVLMQRSNYTPIQNVLPKVVLYPENPVVLGEPNVLICLANEFLPPLINLTWLRNGQKVKDRVEETDFYPSTDHSFRRFSYLPFVPDPEDIYYCRVEHRGLSQPLTKEWNLAMAEPLPETVENVACGLGLAVGIAGLVVGTVFFLKGWRQRKEGNVRQGPL